MKIKARFEDLTDEALDHREALYIRLLLGQRPGAVSDRLYEMLCAVRAAMFERGRRVPWVEVDQETAYGSTVRLSHSIRVF